MVKVRAAGSSPQLSSVPKTPVCLRAGEERAGGGGCARALDSSDGE